MEATVLEKMICFHLMEMTVVSNSLPEFNKSSTMSSLK